MRLIKKYSNRKLYDTGAGRYVNLAEVAALVRQGVEFRVVVHDTEEDVTGIVLAETISEEEQTSPALSPGGLHRLIRRGLPEGWEV
jgi:polyhydroxyalkanoate synthesis repressor PhaR